MTTVKRLSVLHVSLYDNRGGSAKSAYKIHRGLKALGVQSRMMVSQKFTSDADVDTIAKGAWKGADRVIGRGLDKLNLQYLLYPSTFNFLRHPWFREADIIQLYNIHSGYFSHSLLPLISSRKKIVWRLSDMWPLTGHCAYSGDCGKWMTGCKGCPDLATYPSLGADTAALLFKWKRLLYSRTDMQVVAPSKWIKEIAEQSPLLGKYPVSYIPNGLDTEIFRPLPRSACRSILGIDETKKVALFLAHALDDPKKGGDSFVEAMNALWDSGRTDIMAMAVGENGHAWEGKLKCPVWKRDYVGEDELLAMVYGAADVFVHCAIRENFPNTTMEALACGVPVVAFDSGGVRELVIPGVTGILARPGSAASLSEGIRSLLDDESARTRMAKSGRERIEGTFTLKIQATALRDMYLSLLGTEAPR
ncbi:MAG: putative Glycosyl transferase, group 1 [Fibrobacteres bacterium]|nr:putative Glycosyl transferase, group 1 [Fibrobacterota bacterium]